MLKGIHRHTVVNNGRYLPCPLKSCCVALVELSIKRNESALRKWSDNYPFYSKVSQRCNRSRISRNGNGLHGWPIQIFAI